VQSVLEGTITVSSQVDSIADYSGFRILVAQGRQRRIDTLGHAVTDARGHFSTTVGASERGIYPLMIWGRDGQRRLLTTEYVVADGDSASMDVEFPVRRRIVRIKSPENAALLAYRNTMALHRQELVGRLRKGGGRGGLDPSGVEGPITRTTGVLWDMRRSFPGTYAAQLASVEAMALLEGWNDSLVVARMDSIAPSNPRYVDAVRVARRAMARRQGQRRAIDLVRAAQKRAATRDQKAALQAVQVDMYLDSLQQKEALAAARDLQSRFSESEWAAWAERASYEANNLLPGMKAPAFDLRTVDGDSVSLDRLQGTPTILEFYRPGDNLYTQQIPTRNALIEAIGRDSLSVVSVSLEPDTVLNRAFFEGRRLPGHRVIAPGGTEGDVARTYNVVSLPKRYLIDADGRIVDGYVGTAFLGLRSDLFDLRRSGSSGPAAIPSAASAPTSTPSRTP
jgi:peroxiredoxin